MIFTKKLRAAPQKPGVYVFKKGRAILYIGKAINLRARLKSYAKPMFLDPAKRAMVAEADSISWEETTNDIEALLKEAQLIKRHRPKYNVLLRDDKNYSFVGFTKEKFPRVFVTHQPIVSLRAKPRLPDGQGSNPAASTFSRLPRRDTPRNDYTRYLGPFTDGAALKKTLHMLRRIFPYCVCKQSHKRERVCQYAQMGLCVGVCCVTNRDVTDMTKVQLSAIAKNCTLAYRKNIIAIRAILSGRRVDIIKNLTKKLRALSHAKHFEEAASIRDQRAALERIFVHRPFLQRDTQTEHEKGLRLLQTVAKLPSFPRRIEAYDISHHHGKESVGSMAVFEDGMPAKSQYRKFKIRHVPGINDPAMIGEVLTRRLRHAEWPMPDFILIDGGKPQLNAVLQAFSNIEYRTLNVGALAKREEELYLPPHQKFWCGGLPNKKPLALKTAPPALLHLLQHLRNEAHRFAISFSSYRFRKQQIV